MLYRTYSTLAVFCNAANRLQAQSYTHQKAIVLLTRVALLDSTQVSFHLSKKLSWSANTTATVKKARQRLNFMRVHNTERRLLVAFCRATTVNSTTSTVLVLRLYGESSRGGGWWAHSSLPLLEFIVTTRYLSKARNITDSQIEGQFLPFVLN